jgi:hypothetical protein
VVAFPRWESNCLGLPGEGLSPSQAVRIAGNSPEIEERGAPRGGGGGGGGPGGGVF